MRLSIEWDLITRLTPNGLKAIIKDDGDAIEEMLRLRFLLAFIFLSLSPKLTIKYAAQTATIVQYIPRSSWYLAVCCGAV
jgi:hypothetical protein